MVPLNVRSAYSLLQSPMLPQNLVSKAKERGYQAVGIADESVLYAMDEFNRFALKNEIKPVLGLTIHLKGLLNHAMDFPIALYVENQQGYHHLLKISSLIKTAQSADLIEFADLKELLGGLYLVIPPVSELSLIMMSNAENGAQFLQELHQYISSDHTLLGVDLQMNDATLQNLKQLGAQTGTKLIAFDEVSYLDPEDQFAQRVLQKIAQGETIVNLGLSMREPGLSYLQQNDLWANAYNAKGLSDAAQNTDWLARHSQFEVVKTAIALPPFTNSQGLSAKDYLQQLAEKGLKIRLHDGAQDFENYQSRLDEELKIIDELGFNEYFLIVWDVIDFAHRNAIRTGPGRGSAAGSLVAFTLQITDVDPIQYDLLFERFLNPERAQMPDIDIDIPDNKREIVLDYLHTKYGHEQVAQIITFSTLAMKQSIRDVARVFGLKPSEMDTLAKAIPSDAKNLADAFETSQRFKNALIDLPIDGKILLQTAQKLEGLPRNHSLHAAGVVLSAESLVQTIPVQLGDDGRLVTQLTKNPVEELGLLKMDFLALSNLNILDIALNEVAKETEGFNINQIDLDDQSTLQLFRDGQTNGVFQFESAGMKNMLRRLQPDRFEDLIAANALFRPGPMQNIPTFIARKHGQEEQTILDPSVADILAPTYGIIVYQEQVMRVAQRFANFSLGDADLLRRAMSKKDATKIAAIKIEFIAGALANGHAQELAERVYGYIETFAEYGFNRSHSVAYSKLAFQLAFLKVHYPLAFFKAVLNAEISNQDKVRSYVSEAKAAQVLFKGPNINASWAGYSVTKNAIQMGLASIRGLRKDFRENIITARQSDGAFQDLGDFISRIDNKFRNVDTLQPLAYVGAFDHFNNNRRAIIESLQGFIDAIGLAGESMSLFKSLTPKIRVVDDFSQVERLEFERQYLGIYLSGHPLETVLEAIDQTSYTNVANLLVGQKRVKTILYIDNVKVIRTKKGDQMAFVDALDLTGKISLTIFPQLYMQVKDLLKNEGIIAVYGNVEQQRDREDLQIVSEQIISAQQLLQNKTAPVEQADEFATSKQVGQWYLRVPKAAFNDVVNTEMTAIFQVHHGDNPVLVVYEQDDRKVALPREQWLKADDATMEALRAVFGINNVVLKKIN